jgi:hypothetical protein
MSACAFAAIAPFKVICRGKNNDSLIGVVVVSFVQSGMFSFHGGSEGAFFLLKSIVHKV